MIASQINTLTTTQNAMLIEQRAMSGRIAQLTGNDYESRAVEQSCRLVRDHLDMLDAEAICDSI